MTVDEADERVRQGWQMEHSIDAMVIHLVCLGIPRTRAEIREVIRSYCDSHTENRQYGGPKCTPT